MVAVVMVWAVVVFMLVVMIVIMFIVQISILHEHLAVIQIFAIFAVVAVGWKATRGQRRRVFNYFCGFFGKS